MWQEICLWLEQYSGVTYDFNDEFDCIYDEMIFIDTFDWYNRYLNIKDELVDIIDIINEHGYDIPDEFPNPTELKTIAKKIVFDKLVNMVNVVKTQLGFEVTDITSFSDLDLQALTISNLVSFIRGNSINEIIKNKLFEKHEEDTDDMFTNILALRKSDLSSIRFAIDDIRTAYFESLKDDDE